MPNIEIKAKCHDLKAALIRAKELSTEYIGLLHQVDTYYATKTGRLKLREINGTEAQLIPYYKDYSMGPMKSNYDVLQSKNPVNLKSILDKILGTVAIVDKNREVYLIDNVRIHLDKVKGLGNFIEFEAVYEEQTIEDKEREVRKVQQLMDVFNIQQQDLLDRSYIDYFLDEETKKIEQNLKILYFFENEDLSLIEIQKLDFDENVSMDQKYFWLIMNKKDQKLERLDFKSMSRDDKNEERKFIQGDLSFTFDQAKLNLNSKDNLLKSAHPMFVSEELKSSISELFLN